MIYENGVFRPEVPVDLPPGTRGDLEIRRPTAELSDEEVIARVKKKYPRTTGCMSPEQAGEMLAAIEEHRG